MYLCVVLEHVFLKACNPIPRFIVVYKQSQSYMKYCIA